MEISKERHYTEELALETTAFTTAVALEAAR